MAEEIFKLYFSRVIFVFLVFPIIWIALYKHSLGDFHLQKLLITPLWSSNWFLKKWICYLSFFFIFFIDTDIHIFGKANLQEAIASFSLSSSLPKILLNKYYIPAPAVTQDCLGHWDSGLFIKSSLLSHQLLPIHILLFFRDVKDIFLQSVLDHLGSGDICLI